ncbi:hypothetical protein ACIBQ0_09805 [Nocardia nova]|uniref:hypothetical protein n=1 Tax=Nocardia nova TaxID=37330 RepID=UPI0037B06D47
MSTWEAALLAVGAIVLTYFFCVRPALRGRHGGRCTPGAAVPTVDDREIASLREEVRVLRARAARPGSQATPGDE